MTARIVARQRIGIGVFQQPVNRLQGYLLTLDFGWIGGIGKNTPFLIQQINLNAGVDTHVEIKQALQLAVVNPAIDNQIAIGNQMAGQVTIKRLVHRRAVFAHGVETQHGKQPANNHQQQEQAKSQARIQGLKQGSGPGSGHGSVQKPVTDAPHRLHVTGLGRIGFNLVA